MNQYVGRIELAHNKALIGLLGLSTHYILNASEWDTYMPRVLATWVLAFGGIAAAEYTYNPWVNTVGDVVAITLTTAAVYFGTMSASILLYRGFFHRLRKVVAPPKHVEYLLVTDQMIDSRSVSSSPIQTS